MAKNKNTRYDEDDEELGLRDEPKSRRPDLKARMLQLQEDWNVLRGDTANATKRAEIAREMRAVRDAMVAEQPIVAVTVPRLPGGKAIKVGDKTFGPGVHRVRAGTAQVIMHIIDEAQRQERRRFESRQMEFDAADPSARVRAILAEDYA